MAVVEIGGQASPKSSRREAGSSRPPLPRRQGPRREAMEMEEEMEEDSGKAGTVGERLLCHPLSLLCSGVQ